VKIIVYVEHGLGGTRAWVNTDVKIDECIVVDCPSDNVAGEKEAFENTTLLDGPYCCDGFDQPISTDQIEKRMAKERADQATRDERRDDGPLYKDSWARANNQ
jgi:hypothetical protein